MTDAFTIAVTDDAFLGGRLRILQPRDGYRAGLDAVLLAATVDASGAAPEPYVVDAGAGVGVVGLCVASRLPRARVVLVEREPELADLARRNVDRNGLAERVQVVLGDVTGPVTAFDSSGIAWESATHVLANPPFTLAGEGSASPRALKASSHQMSAGSFDQWARFLARAAVPSGTVTIVHRADALVEVLSGLSGRFGAIAVRPIHPRMGEPASRILASGIKGSRAPLVIQPGLVLHGDARAFRPEIEAILRDGAGLSAP
jgi:tRNA1(Val) A37 N6-methylase TrmN6